MVKIVQRHRTVPCLFIKVIKYKPKKPGYQNAEIEYVGCLAEINIKVEFTFWQWVKYIFTFAWLRT